MGYYTLLKHNTWVFPTAGAAVAARVCVLAFAMPVGGPLANKFVPSRFVSNSPRKGASPVQSFRGTLLIALHPMSLPKVPSLCLRSSHFSYRYTEMRESLVEKCQSSPVQHASYYESAKVFLKPTGQEPKARGPKPQTLNAASC